MSNEEQNPASCQIAVMRSPYFFVLIFSKLETILKIVENKFVLYCFCIYICNTIIK